MGVRRYGFHGASHRAASERAQAVLGRSDLRHVSCHLGGSSSVAAIRSGVAVDTSFGLSPQSGLPQNNRVGDMDAFAALFVMKKLGLDVDAMARVLANESGLAGISGGSGDVRDLEAAAAAGDAPGPARPRRVRGGGPALPRGVPRPPRRPRRAEFSGGIGENSAAVRAAVCAGLSGLGIELDPGRNAAARGESVLSPEGRGSPSCSCPRTRSASSPARSRRSWARGQGLTRGRPGATRTRGTAPGGGGDDRPAHEDALGGRHLAARRDRGLDARHVAGQQHEALAADRHREVDAEEQDVGGLGRRVGDLDDARGGEGLDDAEGAARARAATSTAIEMAGKTAGCTCGITRLLDERPRRDRARPPRPPRSPPPRRRRPRRCTCPSRSCARAAAPRRRPSASRPGPGSRSRSLDSSRSPIESSCAICGLSPRSTPRSRRRRPRRAPCPRCWRGCGRRARPGAGAATRSPTRTRSPDRTAGMAGAPACCLSGSTTRRGRERPVLERADVAEAGEPELRHQPPHRDAPRGRASGCG